MREDSARIRSARLGLDSGARLRGDTACCEEDAMRRPAIATIARSCCTTPAAASFWAAMFVLFYGATMLIATVWRGLHHYGDTAIMGALAAACFVNFGRNRTLHCALTGPLYFVGAIVALLMEAGIWNVNQRVLWAVVLTGVAVAFLIEWRTVGRQGRL